MAHPPKSPYCSARRAAALLAFLFLCIAAVGQTAARKMSPGPRAVGLLQFDDKGKVHLVPVVIMMNGEFYDASIYKATPVPMALEDGTVYEGIRTGESQGLFTIIRPRQVMGIWTAEGNWEPGGPKPEAKRAPLAPKDEPESGPPVLRRGVSKPEEKEPAPPTKPAAEAKAPDAKTPEESKPVTLGGEKSEPLEPAERPVLKHGIPASLMKADDVTDSRGTAAWKTVTTITAVSDAKVIEPRSYHFLLKGDEEQELRDKMLELAAQQVKGAGAAKSRKSKTKPAKPQFEDVKFEAFDPSSNNEPVYVLSASLPASMPKRKEAKRYLVLVARQDIYAEFHVAFFRISDPQHLDSSPRFELIDAVDADGDGYAELLFRRTSDAGHAYSVYRVIGNQLWPIFEGTPQ